jgi:uncharacterized protein DUF2721
MPPSDLTKIISSSVVPVVIISACGLLALAFYNRLHAIVSRLRGFQRERLHERDLMRLAATDSEAEAKRRRQLLKHLETQTARVMRRAKLIRLTLLFLLLTVGLLVGCCLMLGLSVLLPGALYVAISLFDLGLLCMLSSAIAAALELKGALEPAELESQFVTDILRDETPPIDDAV